MNLARELRRGAVRLLVLHHAVVAPVNGAWMSGELARQGYRISPGTLYPLLHDLEAHGLLRHEADAVSRGGLRSYAITDAGRAALAEGRVALAELASELLAAD